MAGGVNGPAGFTEKALSDTYDANIPAVIPSKDGFEFLYWQDKDGVNYRVPTTITLKPGVTKLTAIWKEKLIEAIYLKGSPSVDIGAEFKIAATTSPEGIKGVLKWDVTQGVDNISIKTTDTDTDKSALIKGLKTGPVKIKVYVQKDPKVFAEFPFKVNGESFGSPENPLEGIITSTFEECIGDRFYIKQGSALTISSINTATKKCSAYELTPDGTGFSINTDGSVSGSGLVPGTTVIKATYWDENVLATSYHTVTIYTIPPAGAVARIKVTGNKTIVVGDTITLTAEALPENAANKKLAWYLSSGADIVSLGTPVETASGGTCKVTGLKTGTATLTINALDGYGATFNVELTVKDKPDAPDVPLERADDHVVSYISVHHDNKTERVVFPIVSSIEDAHTVELSEISTIVFGSEAKFIMDLGSSKRINVTITRMNPPNYNDADTDPERWSNGKWYNNLRRILDFWQNFGETPNPDETDLDNPFLKTGGFMFYYLPPKYDLDDLRAGVTNPKPFDLFPEIKEVVFMLGSMNPRFGIGKMSVTLPLVVARMTGRTDTPETVDITYSSNLAQESVFVLSTPKQIPTPMPMPIDQWKKSNNNYAFKYWTESTADTSDTSKQFLPGQMLLWDSPKKYYAQWSSPIDAYLRTENTGDSYVIVAVPVAATRMIAYVIGGGGGGGHSYDERSTPSSSKGLYWPGGAGGGGQLIVRSFGLEPGQTIRVIVGRGGAGGRKEGPTASDDEYMGKPGKRSSITILDSDGTPSFSEPVVAEGGAGGQLSRNPVAYPDSYLGKGGLYYYRGGDGVNKGMDGNDGSDGDEIEPSLGGRGGKAFTDGGVSRAGGSGGGSPPMSQIVTIGDTVYQAIAKGGDGGYYDKPSSDIVYHPPTSGKLGGGGGSGVTDGANGADGGVFLVFFN